MDSYSGDVVEEVSQGCLDKVVSRIWSWEDSRSGLYVAEKTLSFSFKP